MLADLALFLAAAVVAVPLSKRLGFGAVLGYLLAGMLIGPHGFGWIDDYAAVFDFSEFGVVLMMFVIGLELQPSRLWALRESVFGLGALQVGLSMAVLAFALHGWLHLDLPAALVGGFGLAMSSTAFVLQMLGERKELSTRHGRAAFGILLFQDIAVIPALALLPWLAPDAAHTATPPLQGALIAAAAVAGVIVGGRWLLRPVLRVVASMQMPELFTAAALLVVTATALLMQFASLSMSLGAFLAGLLLADSEYRHELEADIAPFKGLLLGLFFMAVGMSADLTLLRNEPWLLLQLTGGLIVFKALVLFAVGRATGEPNRSASSLALALAQGGEFAFVLFNLAASGGLLPSLWQHRLVMAVTLSMSLAPILYATLVRRRSTAPPRPYDEIDVPENAVIIAGFGTFGQIFGRMLRVKKISYTVLEKNWQHVDFVRRFGNRVFYSDAGRIEVLRAARADKARFLVLAISNPEESLRVAAVVRRNFPQLRIFACAADRMHAMKLMDLGVHDVIRRSYGSSLEMTSRLLRAMGYDEATVSRDLQRFRRHDEETLRRQYAVHRDEKQLIQTAQQMARELETLFEADHAASPPPRKSEAPPPAA